MNTWQYVGGHDAVDLTGVGTVAAGEPFETDLDLAGRPDFELVGREDGEPDLARLKIADLRALAAERGIDHKGLNKPALIAALTENKES